MQSNKTIPLLAVIAGLLFPHSAAAVRMPRLASITVVCKVVDGVNHTVQIMTEENYPMFGTRPASRVDYIFRNSVTHQIQSFTKTDNDRLPSFPVPEGNYDLTIVFATTNGPIADAAQVLYNNITVPHIVSTSGRGKGCAFG